jgi:hypothetical protein
MFAVILVDKHFLQRKSEQKGFGANEHSILSEQVPRQAFISMPIGHWHHICR